jgi:hypothetical protein
MGRIFYTSYNRDLHSKACGVEIEESPQSKDFFRRKILRFLAAFGLDTLDAALDQRTAFGTNCRVVRRKLEH